MMVDKQEDELSNTSNLKKRESSSFNIKDETIVFVSYVREDYEAANRLCIDLKNANLNLEPWIDTGILVGQNWEHEINKAIQASRYFIPLISLKAVEKGGYTKKEFEYALKVIKETQERQKQKIIVIPARINDCKIPYSQLEKIQYVDLFPDWKEGFEKILKAIKLGDNLVGGYQFEENRVSIIKKYLEFHLIAIPKR
jgi:predicted Zn-ribbon and HTH transcriptional regulator